MENIIKQRKGKVSLDLLELSTGYHDFHLALTALSQAESDPTLNECWNELANIQEQLKFLEEKQVTSNSYILVSIRLTYTSCNCIRIC